MFNKQAKTVFIFLIILTSLYIINDFFFINVNNIIPFLIIDYSYRMITLIIILVLIKKKILTWQELGFNKLDWLFFIIWSLALSIIGIIIDQFGWRLLESVLPKTNLFNFPKYDNKFIKIIDLSFGLILVAFSEEIVFRGYYHYFLKSRIKSTAMMVVLSSFIFGLIHWSLGLHAIITTTLIGCLFMLSLHKTKSLYPAIVAHFMINFVAFSKLIPISWFNFLYQ